MESKSKPIIAVDLDDVLTDHHAGLISWFNSTYGTSLTLADVHGRDPAPWGTNSDEEAIRRVHSYFESSQFLDEQPFATAIEVLNLLHQKFDLVIITGRDYMIEDITRTWLSKHFPNLFKNVHFTAQYSLTGKSRSKAELALSEAIDFLIDDNVPNVLEVSEVGVVCILFGDYPWNQGSKLPETVVRCSDWLAVKAYFDER